MEIKPCKILCKMKYARISKAKAKIEKSRIAAALSEKVCVYSIKEGKFAN